MDKSHYVDLSLWLNNTSLFKNIRTYLCHINSDVLHYTINRSEKTIYMKSCAYKTRSYLSFLNHINNLCKFQKKFKLYYKRRTSYNLMSSKYIYIVSVLLNNSLPKLHIFSNKICASDFAFNEATQFSNRELPYSDDGNYILTQQQNKITISTHYTLRSNIYSDACKSIYMTTSPKIIYEDISFSIDLNDSGILDSDEQNPKESVLKLGLYSDKRTIEPSYEPSYEQSSENIHMELDEEYINTNIDELFNIFSITNDKNDKNDKNEITHVEINTRLLHTSFDTYPRIMRRSFSKINDDINFWDTDDGDDDDDDDDDDGDDNCGDTDDNDDDGGGDTDDNDDNDDDDEDDTADNDDDTDDDNFGDENADVGLSLHDFYDKYKINENGQRSNQENMINKSDL